MCIRDSQGIGPLLDGDRPLGVFPDRQARNAERSAFFLQAPGIGKHQLRTSEQAEHFQIALRWQDNERAEEQLVPYVDSLAAAIRADPRLGGRIASGLAQVVEAQGTFVVIGGALLRCLDLYTETLVKE